MKKIFTITICVLLLLMLSVSAFAAEKTVIKVTASEKELHRGDVVTFTVSISGDNEYRSMGFKLSYDPEVYEFVSGSCTPNADAKSDSLIFKFDENTKGLASTYDPAKKYSGTVLTFQLKVLSDADFASSSVSVTEAKLVNSAGEVPLEIQDVKLPVKCVHKYEYTFVEGETTHTGTCGICGDVLSSDHKWGDGTTVLKPTCTEKGQEQFTCTLCSATRLADLNAIGHAWENDCDSTCENGCGKTRDADHKFKTTISSDKNRHWYECEVCGKEKDVYEHTPGPAATENEAQTCEICGYVIQEALGHTYDDVCDDTCNSCGETREAPHAYSHEWRGSAEGHWHVCMACQQESPIAAHVPGTEATEEEPQVCTECNYWLQFPLNHVHNLGETWHCDDNSHWQSCTECFAEDEKQDHEWDEGTPNAEDGSILYTCTVCAYVKTESQQPGGEEETTPTEPSQPVEIPDDTTQREEGFPWWIVAAVAAGLMLIGIILLILEWRRSQKTNMHGKYSS